MSGFPRLGYPAGLIGATAATRYVGATVAGAPVAGTFQLGDFIIDQTGAMYFCTAAGSPGTWAPMAGIVGAFVETNGSYAATTTPVLRTRVAGDPNPRFEIDANGKLLWGDGTAALDTTLSRGGGFQLDVNGYLTAGNQLVAQYAGGTETRLGSIGGASGALFGIAGDTNLYRVAADQLKTDDALTVGGAFIWLPTAGSLIYLGTGADVNLYRAGADLLQTDDQFRTNGNDIIARVGAASQVAIGADGPAGEAAIAFGPAGDTNLYRSSADKLMTDDAFVAAQYVGCGNGAWFIDSPVSRSGGAATGSVMSMGSGAPNNALGANGDLYVRTDGAALTTIYQRRAGAWVGIV